MLADKPLDFENLCLPANRAHDWLGQLNITDMCRSKVITLQVLKEVEDAFKTCLQKALAFFAKQGFSRELRQYMYVRNTVVECRCFGMQKPAQYCRSKSDKILQLFLYF